MTSDDSFDHDSTYPESALRIINQLDLNGIPSHLEKLLRMRGFLYSRTSLANMTDADIDKMQNFARSELYVIPPDADTRSYLGDYARQHKAIFEITEGERYLLHPIQKAVARRSKGWWRSQINRNASTTSTDHNSRSSQARTQGVNCTSGAPANTSSNELLTNAQRAEFTRNIRRVLKKNADFNNEPEILAALDSMEILHGGTSDDPTASVICPVCKGGLKLSYRSGSFNTGNFNRHYTKRHLKSRDASSPQEAGKGTSRGTMPPKRSRKSNDSSTEGAVNDQINLSHNDDDTPNANSTTIDDGPNNQPSPSDSLSESSIPSNSSTSSYSESQSDGASSGSSLGAMSNLTLGHTDLAPLSDNTDGLFLRCVVQTDETQVNSADALDLSA
ncbi:hypothetical protein QAD02_000698 [Eretmocerus hayati]|uniref:Uncharacterized protein n=1 Tax=Eretmocerus hayati TaxID=131215 RepID=A0ACC2NGG0_9HYME|nr:hypothetical protein QAD02_000698 [Eretmocerus hayati]